MRAGCKLGTKISQEIDFEIRLDSQQTGIDHTLSII